MMPPGANHVHGDQSRQASVLILSHDVVAAALLGGLVEILGYPVRFQQAQETAEESVRRVRPRVCLVDCNDPRACRAEFLGRAGMRGVCVVIFGTARALERVRTIVMGHDVETLTMPPQREALELVLQAGSDDQ